MRIPWLSWSLLHNEAGAGCKCRKTQNHRAKKKKQKTGTRTGVQSSNQSSDRHKLLVPDILISIPQQKTNHKRILIIVLIVKKIYIIQNQKA